MRVFSANPSIARLGKYFMCFFSGLRRRVEISTKSKTHAFRGLWEKEASQAKMFRYCNQPDDFRKQSEENATLTSSIVSIPRATRERPN
jgi:hypothetical protein